MVFKTLWKRLKKQNLMLPQTQNFLPNVTLNSLFGNLKVRYEVSYLEQFRSSKNSKKVEMSFFLRFLAKIDPVFVHVKSKWQFKNSSLEKSHKSFWYFRPHVTARNWILFELVFRSTPTHYVLYDPNLLASLRAASEYKYQPIFYPSMPNPDCQ